MPNIKFNYRYRDGGNYKNHGSVVFANADNIQLIDLENLILSKLIDETYFYVDQWSLPDLHFSTWDNQLDHTWHEFESIEYTHEIVNAPLALSAFIKLIEGMKPCNY